MQAKALTRSLSSIIGFSIASFDPTPYQTGSFGIFELARVANFLCLLSFFACFLDGFLVVATGMDLDGVVAHFRGNLEITYQKRKILSEND